MESRPVSLSNTVLALDLGPSSVGWALVDEKEGRLYGLGSRVFPEGVDRDNSGAEHPKNEARRIARGMRRQISRRSRRKQVLRNALVTCGLLPEAVEAQKVLDQLDPYDLRRRALCESLSPHEIGRLLVHLNQRRGFLSNRKADRSKASETSAMLAEISELAAAMGDQTLGQYFAAKRELEGANAVRVRGNHTRREMYMLEFNRIWEFQRQFHPALLTDKLKFGARGELTYPREPEPLRKRRENSLVLEYGIHGILFFQRALYWPSSVIGRCELEPREKRCPRMDRAAQRFRLLNEVNNLRILPQKGNPRPLTSDERQKLLTFLADKKERSFDEMRKHLELLEGDGFNLEIGDRRKLSGMSTDVLLARKDLFGSGWKKRPDAEKTAIVRSLLHDSEEVVRVKAVQQWGCAPDVAERLIDTDLDDGYASYGVTAIEKLLPHLERGLPMMSRDGSPSALSEAGYLRPDQRAIHQRDSWPEVPLEITNPLVRQALFEVRKLVNSVIREFGKPAAIHLELAREVKGNSEQRRKAGMRQRAREREREEAARQIRELGHRPNRDAIERFLLWKEQDELCMYSGLPMSPAQLFGGEVDIDHILPYPRSLDNSLMNKVVAFRRENVAKGNRTPHEWLALSNPKKFDEILQRAANLPYEVRNAKRPRFQTPVVEISDFLNRQLSDTTYITSKVREYLECLGVDIVCTKGQCTAELRHMWGLSTVLRDDDLNLKNREDHRHHAVDALVIALTTRSRLQQLARVRYSGEQLPPPWPQFRETIQSAVDGIKVSHRTERKVAGALHEETLYGPTSKPHRTHPGDRPHAKNWIENEGEYVYRKNLIDLTPPMIDDIRDVRVKELVVERLRRHGIEPGSKQKIPKDVWTDPLLMIPRNGHVDNNTPVIKKVRLIKRDQTIRPIRGGAAYVKPGSTHHICIFETAGQNGKKQREMIAVSMLTAIERVKNHQPLIQRTHPTNPEAKFVMSLSRGEMVLATIKGREDLYVFRTAASTQGQIYFYLHTDARPSATAEKFAVKANTLNGVKVTVDLLGRIRNASD